MNIDYENLKKLNEPFLQEFKESFDKLLESGWFILGNEVKEFEKNFATYCKSTYCVGVANGLDAITLSLQVLDLPKGSEVIVPSNTYIATILSIVQLGLKPILVEPNILTYNIDADKIEEKITKNTSAILVVHLYGKCCEMDKICNIAQKYNLPIVEDVAQAHGAKYKNQIAGNFGEFGAFSFYPTKNLGALGDAGAVTTNNFDFEQRLKRLRNYGSERKYYNEEVGVNSRLDEIQAGFLNVKLKKLDEINTHKRSLAKIYQENLSDLAIKPFFDKNYYDVFHIYNIRCEKRDELRDFLLKNGIKTEIHYPVAPNKQSAMRGILDHFETPIAEKIHQTTLSLPISYYHSEQDVNYVCEKVNEFF
jgi:dTDP-4-amino-4,6-dideoxygalactose transaminase